MLASTIGVSMGEGTAVIVAEDPSAWVTSDLGSSPSRFMVTSLHATSVDRHAISPMRQRTRRPAPRGAQVLASLERDQPPSL